MKKFKTYGIIALVILGLLFFVGTSIKSCSQSSKIDKLEQKLSMAEASRDSISTVYNKSLKSWEYSRSMYVANENVLKSDLAKYSKQLDSLRKAKPKADAGFVADTETETDIVFETVEVIKYKDSLPTYKYTYKDQFNEGKATAYPDSLRLNLITKTGLVGVMDQGRLQVTPTNPNVKITNLEGFQVTQPKIKTKFWRGFTLGVGLGAVATGAIILAK